MRFNIGEIELLIAALDAMPFEARPENYYLLKDRLAAELERLK